VNAALGGMGLPTAIQNRRTRYLPLKPDVVILYPSPVQYLDIGPPLPAPLRVSPPLASSAALRPVILGRFRGQLKAIVPQRIKSWRWQRHVNLMWETHGSDWPFRQVPDDRLNEFEADIRDFVGQAQVNGAQVILATHANLFTSSGEANRLQLESWQGFVPRASQSVIVEFDSAASARVTDIAAELGLPLVDLRARIPADRKNFADFVHFTNTGAKLVAGAIADQVLPVVERRAQQRCGPPA